MAKMPSLVRIGKYSFGMNINGRMINNSVIQKARISDKKLVDIIRKGEELNPGGLSFYPVKAYSLMSPDHLSNQMYIHYNTGGKTKPEAYKALFLDIATSIAYYENPANLKNVHSKTKKYYAATIIDLSKEDYDTLRYNIEVACEAIKANDISYAGDLLVAAHEHCKEIKGMNFNRFVAMLITEIKVIMTKDPDALTNLKKQHDNDIAKHYGLCPSITRTSEERYGKYNYEKIVRKHADKPVEKHFVKPVPEVKVVPHNPGMNLAFEVPKGPFVVVDRKAMTIAAFCTTVKSAQDFIDRSAKELQVSGVIEYEIYSLYARADVKVERHIKYEIA